MVIKLLYIKCKANSYFYLTHSAYGYYFEYYLQFGGLQNTLAWVDIHFIPTKLTIALHCI